ncbi:MAG: prepilin-type N-terminal cleavage/methylation domain-containing protein [Candidatus Paceibacterota bacterium]|jgi:type II secretion system protein G
MIKQNKRGFTLIELLVVVAILGLLATIVAVSLTSARARARDARRVSDVRQIELALELYYAAHLQYPDAPTSSLAALATEGFLNMSAFPTDPTSGNPYCYAVGSDSDLVAGKQRQYYHIGAKLENSDSDMLTQDVDDNTQATSSVTWLWDQSPDCGSSAAATNFDGTDSADAPIYDRGVFPR